MAQRNELILRAAAVNVDWTLYPNDSKLEQAVAYAEKTMTAKAGTGTTKAAPTVEASQISGAANI